MADLLIEIGCEDLPAASELPMAEHLANTLYMALDQAGLAGGKPHIYATPRRISACWPDVGERQADQTVERRGPAVQAAYADGEPTKALLGFVKSAGASLSDVSTVATTKGEWVVVTQRREGRSLADIVADAMPELLKTMPMPRRMRWADQRHEFLRPVVWLLAIHGDNVVPLNMLGLAADNVTHGHRFHAPKALTISQPSNYDELLEKAYVIADFSRRRQIIVQQVQRIASEINGHAVMEPALVDEVTALVEWPVAIAGAFDKAFLDIPKEALIQTMQENQRYFAVLDANGKLMPAFITVANLASTHPQTIIDGNERVIRPRFADTMFFWEQDKLRTLESQLPRLEKLLFQEKLGSVADKKDRLQVLAKWLAPQLKASAQDSELAARLCKCDLTSEIVKELPKMQGIAGRYYAARDGHNADIAEAMEQHYFPKQAGGALPERNVAQVVALADKTDTLVGIYGLGLKPTGAKDPFGLRRAALGIVRILVEHQHDVDLDPLIAAAIEAYGTQLPDDLDRQTILDYVIERLRGYALEQQYTVDVVDAVLTKKLSNPMDIMARLEAINSFKKTDAAVSLSAASKRIRNILKKISTPVPVSVDTALLTEPAERELHSALAAVSPTINTQFKRKNYAEAMTSTAALREPVDAFFDHVMVMCDDAATQNNRLALLTLVDSLCSFTADLSQLQQRET